MRLATVRALVAAVLCLLVAGAGHAAGQTPSTSAAPAFGPQWKALIGEWAGDGGGQPGSATGRASYRFEVGEHALVRRNRADVAAAEGRPASVHEDLMMIYPGAKPGEYRATYVDNEDHVIQYSASWSADGKTLEFVSDIAPGAPRFRMTYRIQSADEHTLDFEMAPPGTTAFKLYVSGRLKRVTASR